MYEVKPKDEEIEMKKKAKARIVASSTFTSKKHVAKKKRHDVSDGSSSSDEEIMPRKRVAPEQRIRETLAQFVEPPESPKVTPKRVVDSDALNLFSNGCLSERH